MQQYKPNLYPIIYWAILYGVITTLALFALTMLASFIGILWFPIFLAGLIWGGYRRYEKDKKDWMHGQGIVGTSKAPLEEFKDATRDIAQATQDMIAKHKAGQSATPQPTKPVVTEEILTQEPKEPTQPPVA